MTPSELAALLRAQKKGKKSVSGVIPLKGAILVHISTYIHVPFKKVQPQ